MVLSLAAEVDRSDDRDRAEVEIGVGLVFCVFNTVM